MTTLFDATLMLARAIGDCYSGTATAGSATTLDDTGCTSPNDYWNQGIIFFKTGNNASKSAVIADWEGVTNFRFTFVTPGAACAAADTYTVCSASYNRGLLREAINLALMDMGKIITTDTSLTGVADQRAYALPTGVYDIRRVEVEEYPNHYWKVKSGYLEFDEGQMPGAGDSITLYYMGDHAAVTADSSVINALIPMDMLVAAASEKAYDLRWRNTKTDDKMLAALIEKARQQAITLKWQNRDLFSMPRDPHWSRY